VRQLDPFEGGGGSLELATAPRHAPPTSVLRPRPQVPFAPQPMVELALEAFLSGRGFRVEQHYEGAEVLWGFQLPNSYFVQSFQGGTTLTIQEESSTLSMFLRNLIGGFRDVKLDVEGGGGLVVLRIVLRRRFSPWNELELLAWDGSPLGRIVERWVWLGRRYELCDPSGRVLATLDKGVFSFFSFELSVEGHVVGKLEKQWAGLARELYSQADAFHVTIDERITDARTRLLMVAAGVMIDMVHFERPKKGGWLGHQLSR
jgi:uncharacterized protein YxjI